VCLLNAINEIAVGGNFFSFILAAVLFSQYIPICCLTASFIPGQAKQFLYSFYTDWFFKNTSADSCMNYVEQVLTKVLLTLSKFSYPMVQ